MTFLAALFSAPVSRDFWLCSLYPAVASSFAFWCKAGIHAELWLLSKPLCDNDSVVYFIFIFQC